MYPGPEKVTWSQPIGAEVVKYPEPFDSPSPHRFAPEESPAGQTETPAYATGSNVPASSMRPVNSAETSQIDATLGLEATVSGSGLSVHSRYGMFAHVKFVLAVGEVTVIRTGPGGAGAQKV